MTKQEIEAFALQYHGIHCIKRKNGFKYKPLEFFQHFNYEDIEYIELRNIDSLTDEEVELIEFDSFAYHNHRDQLPNDYLDSLRSIGIAVPFRGYTVEQMIKEGILKLKKS